MSLIATHPRSTPATTASGHRVLATESTVLSAIRIRLLVLPNVKRRVLV
jgi:hypothetical protein